MRKYFFIAGLVAFLALSGASLARADTLFDTAGSGNPNPIVGLNTWYGWTASANYLLSKINLAQVGSQNSGGAYLVLCSTNPGYTVDCPGGNIIATSTFEPTNTMTFAPLDFPFPSAPSIANGTTYYVGMFPRTGSNTGLWANGTMSIYGNLPGPGITWNNPPNNSTTTEGLDFTPSGNFWDVSLSNTTSSSNYWIKVNYSHLSSSTPEFTDSALVFGNGQHLVSKSQNLVAPPIPDGTTWYAWANLSTEAAATTTIASTTPVSFAVYSPTSPIGGVSATTTIASTTITCTSGNWFSDGLCGVISFLFYPSSASINNFTNLKATFQNKPPFGYFSSFQAAMSGLQNGTSSVVILDASSTAAFSSVLSPLQTGIGWLLWFVFAWWAIHRFRLIEL